MIDIIEYDNKNILKIDYKFIDYDLIKNVDYVLPDNIIKYFLMKEKFDDKLLFPFNNNKDKKLNQKFIYASPEVIKLLNDNRDYYTNNINDASIILYKNNHEISKILDVEYSIKNNYFLKIGENINLELAKLNNLITVYQNFYSYNFEYILDFIKKINYSYDEVIFNINSFNDVIEFKKNKIYLLKRKGTKIYDINYLINDFNKKKYYQKYKIVLYKIDNDTDKEFIIMCCFNKNRNIKFLDLLINSNFIENNVVGYNENLPKIEILYYIFGKAKLWKMLYPLDRLYEKYLKILSNPKLKYNFRKLIRIYSFYRGFNNKRLNIDLFKEKYFKKDKLEKILIISKHIVGYGGNQKTARQLYYNLENNYDTYVWSVVPKNKGDFDFKNDFLCDSIHNDDIIKIKNYPDIIKHINETDYDIIINNKLNECFKILKKLNKKISVITHNSMDPFNKLILDNQRNIDKVFTINNKHSQLFIKNRLKCKIMRYINYVEKNLKVNKRSKFKYQMVFIGRLSREKNTNLLLDTFNLINKNSLLKNKIKLVILGDGKNEFFRKMDNVTYYGKVNYELIKLVLMNSDYLILPSSVEGLPFTVLESMSLGIPCICSNINGVKEVINNKNGFLFDLKNYEKYEDNLYNWDILSDVDINYEENKISLYKKILDAYNIDINLWNVMSNNCYNLIKNNYTQEYADKYNFTSFYLY